MPKNVSGLTLPQNLAPLVIALIYLAVSILWIVFSDRILAAWVEDPAQATALQTVKGLFFVSSTTLLLFLLIRFPMKRLHQSNLNLVRAEAKLKLMFDSLTQGVAVVSLENIIVEANPALLKMGHLEARDDVLGKNLLQFFPAEDHEALMADLEKTRQQGVSGIVERKIKRPDGSQFPCTITSSVMKDETGVASGTIALIEDITERKENEAKIRHLNRVLSLVRDINQLIVHEEDELTLLNKACQRTTKNPGYDLTWIALADEHKELRPVAYDGAEVDFELCLKALGRELTKEVHPVVKEECANGRFAAAISLPLTSHDRVIGSFTICSSNPKAFSDDEEYRLVLEVSQDLSLGIEKIRKRAEAAQVMKELTLRNEFIETVTNNLPIGLAVNAPGQPFQYMNSKFEEIYGWPVEIISDVGKFFKHVYPDPDFRHVIQARIMADIASGDPDRMIWENVPVIHQDGTRRYISAINIPLPEQDLIISTVWDVTARHQAEQELALRASLLDASMDAIYVVDAESGKFRYYNEEAHASLGYSREELEELQLEDIIPADGESQLAEIMKGLKEEKQTVFETVHRHKDGREIPVEIRAQPITIEDREYMMGIARDITERKKAETMAHQLRDKAEMSSRLAAVGEMAAGIAHEINNPLTGVIGFSELLLGRPDLPDDVKEELTIINSGSQRVKDIIRRMLTFARQSQTVKSAVNINELLENTLELRSYVLRTSNIELVRDYDPELPWVTADGGQLQQVFLNIVVNAEYAMKKAHDKGILTVKTEILNSHIRASITDDGPGMSEEVRSKLFQPFFTTKEPGEGTGLGLSLSFGIIQEHGGNIEVDSVEGRGTTFIIELPITPIQDVIGNETPVIEDREKKRITRARVLVADDEPTVGALVKKILTDAGHEVTDCRNPEQALEKLRENAYDLIILDIRMPGMSGIKLYEEIKSRWPEQAGKVMLLTGDTRDLVTKKQLNTLEIPYITKPFERQVLLELINKILSN